MRDLAHYFEIAYSVEPDIRTGVPIRGRLEHESGVNLGELGEIWLMDEFDLSELSFLDRLEIWSEVKKRKIARGLATIPEQRALAIAQRFLAAVEVLRFRLAA